MSAQHTFGPFFRQYAELSLGPAPERLAEFYDTSFLVAGPKGGAAFKNDDAFLAWLRQVKSFNETSGLTGMTVGDISETPIGGGYTLVTVEWAATFQRTGERPIRFSISYLLRRAEGALKIAGYISHEDQEDAMRAHGLV